MCGFLLNVSTTFKVTSLTLTVTWTTVEIRKFILSAKKERTLDTSGNERLLNIFFPPPYIPNLYYTTILINHGPDQSFFSRLPRQTFSSHEKTFFLMIIPIFILADSPRGQVWLEHRLSKTACRDSNGFNDHGCRNGSHFAERFVAQYILEINDCLHCRKRRFPSSRERWAWKFWRLGGYARPCTRRGA